MNAITTQAYNVMATVTVDKWCGVQHEICPDDVAEEVPIALEYNGISHAVMLATPADLEDFALGFSLSEGILERYDQLYECELSEEADGIRVAMRISSEQFLMLKERRRNLTGRTGCGLCGAESLQHAIRRPRTLENTKSINAAMIHAGVEKMHAMQHLQHKTGATHAAAWLSSDGGIELVREDVGRHNALDKLIGALSKQRQDFSSGAAIITSRSSYEMVQKSATAGIGILAAVSAPTGLAIRLAEQANVTLVGFVRHEGHVVYAHPDKLT